MSAASELRATRNSPPRWVCLKVKIPLFLAFPFMEPAAGQKPHPPRRAKEGQIWATGRVGHLPSQCPIKRRCKNVFAAALFSVS